MLSNRINKQIWKIYAARVCEANDAFKRAMQRHFCLQSVMIRWIKSNVKCIVHTVAAATRAFVSEWITCMAHVCALHNGRDFGWCILNSAQDISLISWVLLFVFVFACRYRVPQCLSPLFLYCVRFFRVSSGNGIHSQRVSATQCLPI